VSRPTAPRTICAPITKPGVPSMRTARAKARLRSIAARMAASDMSALNRSRPNLLTALLWPWTIAPTELMVDPEPTGKRAGVAL
jgi:hypothetical protein